jgi:hypothetical protein
MTLLQGPVSNAAHGASVNPWFSIGVGTLVLAGVWFRYLRARRKTKVSPVALLEISAVCAVFIAIGIWELLR